jgi:hypothetical protein
MPNINPPSWLVVTARWEGCTSLEVSIYDLMISRLTVLRPMLAKRTINTIMMRKEMQPPVMVLYSVSLLYRSSLLVGNRSTALKNLLTREGIDGMWTSIEIIILLFSINGHKQ